MLSQSIQLFLLALWAAGCVDRPAPVASSAQSPRRAFYFWRTRLELSAVELEALSGLHVGRLFVRFFDVEWSRAASAPRPVAILALPEEASFPKAIEVVPVVFFRADAFGKLAAGDLPALARRVWLEVSHLAGVGGFTIRELQLDCDWTESTRAAYFAFLEHLGRLSHPAGVALSVTIRLHQVKYRERTGVPPVERGMLMFYNMGTIEAGTGPTSIFDSASAARYTARVRDYPLPLDVVLPIWAWTIHVRGDEVMDLLQSTDPAELDSIPWLRRTSPGRFEASRNAFLHGSLLREGDVLKVESMSAADTLAAARMASGALAPATPGTMTAQPEYGAPHPRTVALFDLSERNLARHGTPSLEQLFPLFQ